MSSAPHIIYYQNNKTSILNKSQQKRTINANKGLCCCGREREDYKKKCCNYCRNKCNKSSKKVEKRLNLCYKCFINSAAPNGGQCDECKKQYILPLRTKLFRNSRNRARKAKIVFNIIEEDLIIPEYCPILGMKLQENKKFAKSNSYSVDRIDSTKGYIKDNVHIISHRANQIKNDATIKEIELLLNYLKQLYKTTETNTYDL
jgi:hypothetical protein